MADPKPPRHGAALVVDKIVEVRRTVESLAVASGTERDNTVAKLKAAIAELERQQSIINSQQNDLLGRLAYSTASQARASWGAPVQSSSQAFGPSQSFELDRARVVSITFQLSAFATSHARQGGASANSWLSSQIRVDGTLQNFASQGSFGVVASYSGGPDSGSVSVGLSARWLGILPAGAHVVQGALSPSISVTGGGSGYVEATNPHLFVDVLQPA
ncbi:hypothetical protein [Microbacterium sp. AG238]|uniref:hypothetical protein n=1 Tax=Microbacterium sp. AG238 TaxID=2183994 RepID=UPI000FEFF49E|nr:hypothetical protein [Microbacterium sp. AG238]RKE60470.1 hypothetical protein DEU36_2912 [Microbacterium sp. AG238]